MALTDIIEHRMCDYFIRSFNVTISESIMNDFCIIVHVLVYTCKCTVYILAFVKQCTSCHKLSKNLYNLLI